LNQYPINGLVFIELANLLQKLLVVELAGSITFRLVIPSLMQVRAFMSTYAEEAASSPVSTTASPG
jgi:hypothetical protein